MREGLGNVPLIIVSQTQQDGQYLSLLMSNHLSPIGHNRVHDRIISVENNYFANESIARCVGHSKDNEATAEMYSQLHLLMDEGFDTDRLYGIQLMMDAFSMPDMLRFFANAKFVFIYNEFDEDKLVNENCAEQIKQFIQQYPENCFVLNSKFLISNPQMMLEELTSFISSKVVNHLQIKPLSFNLNKPVLASEHTLLFVQSRIELQSMESVVKRNQWLDGKKVSLIFYDVTSAKIELLLKKMKDAFCSFLFPVHTICICDSQETIRLIKQTMVEEFNFSKNTFFTLRLNVFANQLNEIIEKLVSPFVCLDDLNTDFSYIKLLQKGASGMDDTVSFAKVSTGIHDRSIGMSDLLLKDYPEHSLFFSKQAWVSVNGFDMSIDTRYLLWDFAIRMLVHYQSQANVYPATFSVLSKNQDTSSFATDENEAYKMVLVKHRSILEKSLDELIRVASTENFLSHQENNLLYEKISSLQFISSHAKDELKSLQELTSQLHQRIAYLENNWYQKLTRRLNRIKKIFFKKKSPGTGSFKRILQFIRFSFSKAGFGIVRKIVANIFKRLYILFEKRPVEIVFKDALGNQDIFTYNDWIKNKLNPDELKNEYEMCEKDMLLKPLISIIMPVYNAPIRYLKEAIESVSNQLYPNWELCIADDCSTMKKVQKLLHVYSVKDKRIKVHYRTSNGHISATSNDALAMAKGEYVLLMDHDDLLTTNCLWEIVKSINSKSDTDILYSDEDKIDESNHHKDAHFKPEWSPDHLLSRNYLGHVTVLRKSLMDAIGGFRLGFEGSQDYDLMLRATEQTTHIVHISKVLYHWRIHQLSAAQGEDVKPYAYIAAKKALEEALIRRGLKGDVKYLSGLRGYKIEYALKRNDLISIIIPTKDQTALLKNTIDSIIQLTAYKQYEIIILNNNSSSKEFYEWADEYTKKYPELIQVVEAHFPFNFSKLMNIGASLSKGEYLLLLNNDVEIIHADWLEIMLSYSQQNRIGGVGVRLLYPDDTIQHAGVIIGLGGIAGHSFVGAYKDEAGYFNYIQSVNNYSAVTAACLMCRKEVFNEVGGMDETFEVEYNDVDFCLKMMEAGYYNVYLPQVELYHYESATRGHPHQSKPSYERHLKEMKLFKDKWQHIIDHDPHYNPNLNLGTHDFSMNFSA